MSDTHSDDESGDLGLFAEPEGYYQPEKQPTFASHVMQDGRELTLRMVGHNPLWVRVQSLLSLAHCLAPSRCL
jgi:nicotinamide N-methyltransferase